MCEAIESDNKKSQVEVRTDKMRTDKMALTLNFQDILEDILMSVREEIDKGELGGHKNHVCRG